MQIEKPIADETRQIKSAKVEFYLLKVAVENVDEAAHRGDTFSVLLIPRFQCEYLQKRNRE